MKLSEVQFNSKKLSEDHWNSAKLFEDNLALKQIMKFFQAFCCFIDQIFSISICKKKSVMQAGLYSSQ